VADDFSVAIRGLAATQKLMRELEPDLLKEMNREIRTQLEPVAVRARHLIPSVAPLSGWERGVKRPGTRPSTSVYGKRWDYARLEWNSSDAKSGIKIRQGGRRGRGRLTSAAWQIRSDDPAAAVFELMGRGKSRANMVRNVGRDFPGTGRALYRAFDSLGGKRIESAVVGTIRRFEQNFNSRLQGAGD
jgi:hypothetical protein